MADDDGAEIRKFASRWMERLNKQREKRDSGWGADAEAAERAYSGDERSSGEGKMFDFNILFSNAETIIPSVFNSSPVPDIRERQGNGDKAARHVADVLERVISCEIDDGRLTP